MAQVLLIEPDKLLATNIRRGLTKRGHKVTWQTNAQSALVSADLNPPDIIVLEPHLALHSGVEFLYEFRSYPDWQAVPVIVYGQTNWQGSGLAKALAELDVSYFATKAGTTLDELADLIEAVAQVRA